MIWKRHVKQLLARDNVNMNDDLMLAHPPKRESSQKTGCKEDPVSQNNRSSENNEVSEDLESLTGPVSDPGELSMNLIKR